MQFIESEILFDRYVLGIAKTSSGYTWHGFSAYECDLSDAVSYPSVEAAKAAGIEKLEHLAGIEAGLNAANANLPIPVNTSPCILGEWQTDTPKVAKTAS